MSNIKKKYSNKVQVIESRSINRESFFNDAHLNFSVSYNTPLSASLREFRLNLFTEIPKVTAVFADGENKYLYKIFENTSLLTKNYNRYEDGNGGPSGSVVSYYLGSPSSFWFSDLHLIEKIKSEGNINSVYSVSSIVSFNVDFPNLKELDFSINANITEINVEKLSSLRILKINFPQTLSYIPPIISETTRFLSLNSGGIVNPVAILPEKIQFLTVRGYYDYAKIELGDFFNGYRMGIVINNGDTISYSGGAIFPTVITEPVDFKIPYIYFQANVHFVTKPLTGSELSMFIVDFANQVTSVVLTNKRMLFSRGYPNISYEDLSQPLFTNYTSALNHITVTLGITVTFPGT